MKPTSSNASSRGRSGSAGATASQASATERARIDVQRRIKLAIARIEQHAPALGLRLAETIRTGTFYAYEPGAARRR